MSVVTPPKLRVDRLVGFFSGLMSWVSALLLLLMMVIIIGDIAFRALSPNGLGPVIEYVEVLLVICIFFALAYARRTNSHVAIDSFVNAMPKQLSWALQVLGLLVVLAVLSLLAWSSTVAALESLGRGEYRIGVAHVAVWPARLVIAIGWFALLLEFVMNTINAFRSARAGEWVVEPRDEQVVD